MKTIVLLILLVTQAHAGIKLEHDLIQPFSSTKYPLKDFIADYANIMNVTISYPEDLIKTSEFIQLEINSPTSKENLSHMFYSVLDANDLTVIPKGAFLWIYPAREIRYLPTEVYTDDSYSKNSTFSMVLFTLKNPLSREIARNIRPILSRYGRVIHFSDGKTILISDLGTNLSRLSQTIANMDTDVALKNVLNEEPTKKEEPAEDKARIMELELEKKLLEKKYLELKEKNS